MAEYIDRELLLTKIKENALTKFDWSETIDIDELKQVIQDVPTADVEMVKHGKWIGKYNTIQYNDWMCNYCGKYESETRNKDRLGNYCRWCGAKMDLE